MEHPTPSERSPLTLSEIEIEIEVCKKQLAYLEDLKKKLQENQNKSKQEKNISIINTTLIGFNGWGC